MPYWKNPFDAPPPIARAKLPGEDGSVSERDATPEPADPVNGPTPEQIQAHRAATRLSLQFTGTSREFFRLWATCQALKFATLGIYSAWAKVRIARYLARHHLLDGASFEYRGRPSAILRGRLLATAIVLVGAALTWWQPGSSWLLVLLAFLPAPWIITHSFAFKWRTLRYRNVGFSFQPNARAIRWPLWIAGATTSLFVYLQFSGRLDNEGASVMVFSLLSIVLGIGVWPYVTSQLLWHRFSNASWGNAKVNLTTTPRAIFWMMWRSGKAFMFLMVLLFGVLMGLAALIPQPDLRSLMQTAAYLLLGVCAVAFGRTRRLNFVLNHLNVNDQMLFMSQMDPNKAARLAGGLGVAGMLSAGLLIPWANVKFARWRVAQIEVSLAGDWTSFPLPPLPSESQSAIAEGISEQFDIELGW